MRNIKDVRQSIPTVDTLILCFKMESYFTDDKFFKYLMSKAYPVWEEFYPRIHELPDEIFGISLHSLWIRSRCIYINRPLFFKEWLQINQNKGVMLYGKKVYHTDTKYYDNISSGNNG